MLFVMITNKFRNGIANFLTQGFFYITLHSLYWKTLSKTRDSLFNWLSRRESCNNNQIEMETHGPVPGVWAMSPDADSAKLLLSIDKTHCLTLL